MTGQGHRSTRFLFLRKGNTLQTDKTSTLRILFEDINKEVFELYAAAKKRHELGKLVVKIMQELKVEDFNELPQNVRNLVARHIAAIMPREEMQATGQSEGVVRQDDPIGHRLALEKCIRQKQKALVSQKRRRL
jgi:hypothetical protein